MAAFHKPIFVAIERVPSGAAHAAMHAVNISQRYNPLPANLPHLQLRIKNLNNLTHHNLPSTPFAAQGESSASSTNRKQPHPPPARHEPRDANEQDRKSTRLNSSHVA